jgi:FkbM family methyltransferase
MKLHETQWVRRLVLPILAKINVGDITIRHHYTGDRVHLHSFRHKGYWFHGKKREIETMSQFAALIGHGDTVFEVGGHIGYISMYLAKLVGDSGFVHVFEPGPNNLPYIRRNSRNQPNIFIEPVGVGSSSGTLPFYIEGLSGQNNSFVRDFAGLRANEESAHVEAQRAVVEVPIVTLDNFASGRGFRPDFVKVDVEGFEYEVLQGMTGLLQSRAPRLMVEVQAHQSDIFQLLSGLGYLAFDPLGQSLITANQLQLNTFFIHRGDDAGIARLRNHAATE